jgi:hypothetical protein
MGRRASRSRGRRELTESGPRSLRAVAVATMARHPIDWPTCQSITRQSGPRADANPGQVRARTFLFFPPCTVCTRLATDRVIGHEIPTNRFTSNTRSRATASEPDQPRQDVPTFTVPDGYADQGKDCCISDEAQRLPAGVARSLVAQSATIDDLKERTRAELGRL